MNTSDDIKDTITKPIKIGINTFIDAHSKVLKGSTIANNSIIGAYSVVIKSITDNEICADNPCNFYKKIILRP